MDISEAFLTLSGLFAIVHGVYWVVGGLFLFTDLTGKPQWMMQYKTQPGKNQPVEINRLKEVLYTIILNQLVAVPFTIGYYVVLSKVGCDLSVTAPRITDFVRDMIIFVIVEEIGFYYSHRLLHIPMIYKTIHKKHHSWTAPIGITAAYAHPVEFFFSNLLPLAAGPVICRSNLITMWTWWAVATIVTIVHHSGYHLPLLPSPEFHDYHHLKFVGNYGLLGVLDWFHQTDREFRKSRQFERHKTILFKREVASG